MKKLIYLIVGILAASFVFGQACDEYYYFCVGDEVHLYECGVNQGYQFSCPSDCTDYNSGIYGQGPSWPYEQDIQDLGLLYCDDFAQQQEVRFIESSNPVMYVDGNRVVTVYTIQLVAGDMQQPYIIEQQIRPKSLAFISSSQYACDVDNPQNVHKTFQLELGESVAIELSSTVVDGDYDVYAVIASDCYDANPSGYTEYEPYSPPKYIRSVSVGEGGGGDDYWDPNEGKLLTYVLVGAVAGFLLGFMAVAFGIPIFFSVPFAIIVGAIGGYIVYAL